LARRYDLGFDPRRPIYAGEDMSPIRVKVLTAVNGSLLDLTDSLALFALFTAEPDLDPTATEIFQKTIGDGITLTDPEAGILTIQIVGWDTDGLFGDFYYELELNVGGVKHTELYGTIRLREGALDYNSIPSLPDFSAADFDAADFAVT
jgi:hypothetical protein